MHNCGSVYVTLTCYMLWWCWLKACRHHQRGRCVQSQLTVAAARLEVLLLRRGLCFEDDSGELRVADPTEATAASGVEMAIATTCNTG